MIIFPAIDIRNGKCVRLVKGDFNQETVFSERPEIMAKKWEDEGGQYLHLVDLDGALKGKSQNLDVVEMILKTVNIPVELGGGIRTMENIKQVLDMGVSRVILGSVAVKDPQYIRQMVQRCIVLAMLWQKALQQELTDRWYYLTFILELMW